MSPPKEAPGFSRGEHVTADVERIKEVGLADAASKGRLSWQRKSGGRRSHARDSDPVASGWRALSSAWG